MADYSKYQGVDPLVFRPHLETAKFAPNSAVAFFAACWRAKTGGPPSASRAAAAAHPPAASARSAAHARCGTRHCPSRRGVTIATHTGAASLWLPCSQVRERATSENGLTGPSRSPGAPHAPRLPPSQRGPHLSCPCGAHHGLIWSPSRRQGGAVEEPQSDAMDVDSTMKARPHAYRPCARHRPRRCSRGCSALWNLLTLVLCRA